MTKEEKMQEFKLRKLVRGAIKIREHKMKTQNLKKLENEQKLRKIVRHFLKEAKDVDASSNPVGYGSTALNAVAAAFNDILKTVKDAFRFLEETEERLSFRIHTLDKMKSIFDHLEALDGGAGGENLVGEGEITEQEEGEEKIDIDIEKVDDPDARIIPDFEKERYAPDEETDEEKEKKDFGEFSIADLDPTGARKAFEMFDGSNIQDTITRNRKTIEDKPGAAKEYREFVLYNVDLWLLTYEEEYSKELGQEPAFTEPIMPRPESAVEIGSGRKFGPPAAGEVASGLEGGGEEIEAAGGEAELPPLAEI